MDGCKQKLKRDTKRYEKHCLKAIAIELGWGQLLLGFYVSRKELRNSLLPRYIDGEHQEELLRGLHPEDSSCVWLLALAKEEQIAKNKLCQEEVDPSKDLKHRGVFAQDWTVEYKGNN